MSTLFASGIIATDKRGIHIIFFLFLHENICCGYSLEVPQRGASNVYPQHMFSWRNKKDFSGEKSALSVSMLECCSNIKINTAGTCRNYLKVGKGMGKNNCRLMLF